ncbi:MAG: hypothetical protein V4651_06935 [Bacteroidota bacterium]
MNKIVTLIALIVLITGACTKKEKSSDPVNTVEQPTLLDCSLSTVSFQQPIPDNQYVDIIEDLGKNIVLLGSNTVEKYNNNGVLIWSKKIGLLGTPQNIIQADGDNYFISSANYQVNDYSKKEFYSSKHPEGTSLTLHSYYTYAGCKLDDCSSMYNKVTTGINDPDTFISKTVLPQNSSTCQLSKINKSGDLLWSKTFAGNHILGKTLTKTPDGNWLLLTAQFSGFYQTAQFDENGVFQDTIHSPQTNNSLTLYKINAQGNVIWERKLTEIYALSDYNHTQNETPVGMAISNQTICINCVNNYIILDLNGNALKSRLPSVTTCRAAYPSVSFGNDHFYSLAKTNNSTNYVQKSDVSGEVVSDISLSKFIPYGQIETSVGGFFIHGEGDITKFTNEGNYMWGKYSLPSYPISLATPSCTGGIIYLQKTATGLTLIKTDQNGN